MLVRLCVALRCVALRCGGKTPRGISGVRHVCRGERGPGSVARRGFGWFRDAVVRGEVEVDWGGRNNQWSRASRITWRYRGIVVVGLGWETWVGACGVEARDGRRDGFPSACALLPTGDDETPGYRLLKDPGSRMLS